MLSWLTASGLGIGWGLSCFHTAGRCIAAGSPVVMTTLDLLSCTFMSSLPSKVERFAKFEDNIDSGVSATGAAMAGAAKNCAL